MIFTADPRRFADRLFGGPHFAAFEQLPDHRIRCVKTGDVFDTRLMGPAWMEGRNLAPMNKGEG